MSESILNRRHLLLTGLAFTTLPALPLRAAGAPKIHVAKDPNCGCCTGWMEILYGAGFKVSYEHLEQDAMAKLKADVGISEDMASCHTAVVDGYIIEGHVPPADILRLLDERPEALGLSVPGMPWGSPGMGPESEREAYQVFLIHRDGATEVFTDYPAAG